MKTVVRLLLSYFGATRFMTVLSVVGAMLLVASWFTLGSLPLSAATLSGAFIGEIALFLGSSLTPLLFGRLARSHLIGILPSGRLKLLVSLFLAVALVSLPLAFLAASRLTQIHHALVPLFWNVYTASFLITGWLYLALWFVTSQRTTGGLFRGLVVIVIMLYAPTRQIRELDAAVRSQLIECAVLWGLFAVGFLGWPRWRRFGSQLRRKLRFDLPAALRLQVVGHELDLLLGTANPWLLAGAQVAPIVIAMRIGVYSAAVWLYYLTILSTVAGAIAGHAAERSRALWLRAGWSREALFGAVERSFWRHNSYVLGALLILMVTIGSYAKLPASLLIVGVPLLVLGTVLSTYLGLMVTRGLQWQEGMLGVAVMLGLMVVAVLAARAQVDATLIITLEILLAAVALALRFAARGRWQRLDWALCRPQLAMRSRGAA